MPSVESQAANPVDALLAGLHESHAVSVYEAIERLVQAGEAVGFDTHTLLRMLDQGTTFEQLLELIEFKMGSLQKAA